jgi:hypothetical protein
MSLSKDEIMKRSRQRASKITMQQVNTSDSNSLVLNALSPLESWELVAKIAREMYFLSTNKIPTSRVDKSIVKIVQNIK